MKFKYTLDLLQNTIQRDNAVLISNHTKIEKRSVIVFRCHCGEEYDKIAEGLLKKESGAFCKKCTLLNTIKKTKDTLEKKYKKNPICTIESLHNTIERDNAILLDDYKEITQNTIIYFICNCGKDSEKNCLQLIKVSGAFCKDCTRITWTRKTKETNIKKYGVECTVHNPEIKAKIIKSNLEKYGVENVFQSEKIKEKIKKNNLEKYGVEHYTQTDESKEKMKKINLEKYGVENYGQTKECREKMKETIIKKYGVEHYSQTDEYKEKIKQTNLEKYGVEHYSQTDEYKEKCKNTFLEKYGVSNPNKTKEIRNKIKETNLKRYGVEYPSQCPNIMEKTQKNARKYKEYTMPNGEIRKVQGYEPLALNELVKLYKEDDILTERKSVPRIQYVINDKKRYYFPDIYIKSMNKIIEVKSTWTYKCKEDFVKEKEEATKKLGYNYEIWIYNKKGEKIVK
jgi:hypothetical protein